MKILKSIAICVVMGLAFATMAVNVCANELPIELPSELVDTTAALCEQYGVDYDIVVAIAWHESRCDPDVEDSPTNDRGIMQINKVNWQWLADEDIDVNVPEQNIKAGILILSQHMEIYTLEESLAAYACGRSGMLNGGGKEFAKEILQIVDTLDDI